MGVLIMNTLTTEQIKEILAGAPDGCNHIGEYPKGKFVPMPNSVGEVHALSDLREILALRERVAELEEMHSGIVSCTYIDKKGKPAMYISSNGIADELRDAIINSPKGASDVD